MISDSQIKELNALGFNFNWNKTNREYIDDSGEYEQGLSYDPLTVGHPCPYTLRQRKWDEETCQYEDEYERFETFADLKAYLA